MFKVPEKTIHEFREIFETHRLQISACNVYYQNIRLLNNHHKILNRDTYVEYYKNIWDYEYYDIIKHEQVVALREINDLCIQWMDTLQRVYIDVYDKLFDNRKYQLKDKYIYKNHCISDGTSRPWLSTTICKYESDSFSIAYDSYCPEDFDVENPPVSIQHTLFFEEFLSRKTPLYDGLHCLLYKGVCDALGFKAEGLTRDYRRLSLL